MRSLHSHRHAPTMPAPLPTHRGRCLPHDRSILNDSYRTRLHLAHAPHVMALGALCLAGVIAQLDLRAWLQGLDTDFAEVCVCGVGGGRLRGGVLRLPLRRPSLFWLRPHSS